jgi:hypothetical protein
MTRLVTCGAILLSLLGALAAAPTAPAAPAAAAQFEDIPYLQVRINQVLEAEPTGAEVEWRNEATGNAGVIRVLKTYFPSPDAPCRDYERTTRRPDGSEELVRGTGCRDASGRWALKEQDESETGAEPPTGPTGAGGQAGSTGAAGGAPTQTQVQGAGQSGRNGASGAPATAAPQPAAKTETAAPEATDSEAKDPESKEPEAAASPPPRAPDPPAFDLPTPSQ